MNDKLLDRCELAFERHLEMLISAHDSVLTACLRGHRVPDIYAMELCSLADAARQARSWFDRHGPCWIKPLPLTYDEHENAFCSSDCYRHIASYFSNSLRRRRYNYLIHPPLVDYCRGLMVNPPDDLYSDPELAVEFPAKELDGLEGTCWQPLPHPARALAGQVGSWAAVHTG